MTPGGVRLGSPAMTTRGMNEADMKKIAGFCIKAIEITKRVQEKSGKKLEDFIKMIPEDEEVPKLAEEVKAFAKQFPMPGK
jgi:glycine hydroxymethyltransferase